MAYLGRLGYTAGGGIFCENANPILTKSIPDLKLNRWGYIETDENSRTNIEGVYAGGDIVSGSATVISAMGAGKRAAYSIHQYLKNKFALIE